MDHNKLRKVSCPRPSFSQSKLTRIMNRLIDKLCRWADMMCLCRVTLPFGAVHGVQRSHVIVHVWRTCESPSALTRNLSATTCVVIVITHTQLILAALVTRRVQPEALLPLKLGVSFIDAPRSRIRTSESEESLQLKISYQLYHG